MKHCLNIRVGLSLGGDGKRGEVVLIFGFD
jgi:hypothetical protein